MDPARWQRIQSLFADALDLPDDDRAAFLHGACAGDAALRAEVEALLAADRRPAPLLDGGLAAPEADVLSIARARLADLGSAATTPLPVDISIRSETVAGLPPAAPPGPSALAALPLLSLGQELSGEGALPETHDLVVRRVLGEGGMGRVLLAWQRSLGREVAIKTLPEGAADSLAESLVREAQISGALEHPVVPPVHAIGRADDRRPLLVMKRIEGTPWSQLVADPAHPAWTAMALPAGDRLDAHLRILARVADAVQFAHSRGYLHRDIKPDNVMVGNDGEVYLVDWGLALALDEAARGTPIRGTPQFMAPEMVAGRPLDARTDVFLLGATLHRVISGAPRHSGSTILQALTSALACKSVSYAPEVPAELASLANAATARDPAERPASAREFRLRLDDFFAHRAAGALAEAALQRVELLERKLGGSIDAADPELQRLVTEGRFGLVEAKRLWPEGEPIDRALGRMRRAAVRLELRRENASAARALLDERGERDPELTAEIEALERRLESRAAEERRLAQLAHDTSPEVALRLLSRLTAVAIVAIHGAVVAAAFWDQIGGSAEPVKVGYVVAGAVFFLITAIVVLIYRRTLRGSALSRRLAIAGPAVLAALVIHRWMAWRTGTTMNEALLVDYLMLGTACLVVSVLAGELALVAAAIWYGCAFFMHLFPLDARLVAGIGSTLFLPMAIFLWKGRAGTDSE